MLPEATLAALEIGDRALFQLPIEALTHTQALRRETLLLAHGATEKPPLQRRQEQLLLERQRQKKRARSAHAIRLGCYLSITRYLTGAPLRAFAELARKFAKRVKNGDNVVWQEPRICLAEDSGVSLSSVATMRRVAEKHGWIRVRVQSCSIDEESGRPRQEASIYEPGPVMWKAIRYLLRGVASKSSLSVQKNKQPGIFKDLNNNTEEQKTVDCNLKGDPSHRPASGPDGSNICLVTRRQSQSDIDLEHKPQPPKFAWEAKKFSGDFTVPGVGFNELRDFAIRNLKKIAPIDRPDIKDPEKIISAIKALYLPHLSDDEFLRIRRHRGWYSITVLLALAANTEFRPSKPIRNPSGWFHKMVWEIPKTRTFRFETLARCIEPDYGSDIADPNREGEIKKSQMYNWWKQLASEDQAKLRKTYEKGPGGYRRLPDIIQMAFAHR